MGASDHGLGLEPADQVACPWDLADALSLEPLRTLNIFLLQHIWLPAPESQQLSALRSLGDETLRPASTDFTSPLPAPVEIPNRAACCW